MVFLLLIFSVFRVELYASKIRGFHKMLRLLLVEVTKRKQIYSFMQSVSISADKESEVVLNLSITDPSAINYESLRSTFFYTISLQNLRDHRSLQINFICYL